MPKLNMGVGFILSRETITIKVSKAIGNYAFGYYKKNKKTQKNEFIVQYVGRSDNNLHTEIIQQGLVKKIDATGQPIHSHFKFNHVAITPVEAYIVECNHFHEHGGTQKLHNKIHPARPKGYTQAMLPCSKKGCMD